MVVVVCSDDLLEVEDGVVEVVQFLERFGFIEVSFAESCGGLLLLLCQVSQLREVVQRLLRHLHLQVEEPSFHIALSSGLLVALNCF